MDRNSLAVNIVFCRWNWQDFWYGFMMVFRVLCGEWIEPLWDCLKATAEQKEQVSLDRVQCVFEMKAALKFY